jgi:hypothetical protein
MAIITLVRVAKPSSNLTSLSNFVSLAPVNRFALGCCNKTEHNNKNQKVYYRFATQFSVPSSHLLDQSSALLGSRKVGVFAFVIETEELRVSARKNLIHGNNVGSDEDSGCHLRTLSAVPPFSRQNPELRFL